MSSTDRIVLDYALDPGFRRVDGFADLTDTALMYDALCGDVRFSVGGVCFDAAWGWVPVLDFAVGVWSIGQEIAEGATKAFEFTESEATLSFAREGDQLTVSSSYAESTAVASVAEFRGATSRFLGDLLRRLVEEHPALATSPRIVELQRGLAAI